MRQTFKGDDAAGLYLELRDTLLAEGRTTSPRGQRTLEIPGVTVMLTDPTRPAPTGVGRGLVGRIGAAESAHLIGGFSDADQLVNCAKNFQNFVEGPAGHRLIGAYGPRVFNQWGLVVRKLCEDHDTRQAGMNLWSWDELTRPSKDVPCTLSLWYQVREGKLEAFTTMRSNDLVWGVPYDWMMFTAAQRALAYALGVEPGCYTHHTYSMHAYVDRDDIESWKHGEDHEFEQPTPYDYFQSPLPTEHRDAERRRGYVSGDMQRLVGLKDGTLELDEHLWYKDMLSDTQSGGKLCLKCRYVLPRTSEHWSRRLEPAYEPLCSVCAPEDAVLYA